MHLYKQSNKRLFYCKFKNFSIDLKNYFENFQKCIDQNKIEQGKLNPIPTANHDVDNFRCKIFSLPFNDNDSESLVITDLVSKYVPDVLFIQFDPMVYLHRQRIFSYKCYLEEMGETHESHHIKGLDIPFPIYPKEAIVNPLILDMSFSAESKKKTDLSKGFLNYHKKAFEDEEIHDNFSDMLINSISKYIFNHNYSKFFSINHLIYQSILNKQAVLLGDMPELLLRLILGNSILLSEVKKFLFKAQDMFKAVLIQMDNHKGRLPIKDITYLYFSHIFNHPKDLYMTGLLKLLMSEYSSTLAFVGSPHFEPIKNYWNEKVNFKDSVEIPKRIIGENEENLIEKQAIFDVMMDTRLWSENYIVNPFQYIESDIKKFSEEEYDKYKKLFSRKLEIYDKLKNRVYEKYENLKNYEKNRKVLYEPEEFSFKRIKNKLL